MPYLSFYRKYRPRTFAEIVGQRHVTQTLANAVKAERIAHAYLFCGPRGTGKTSTARALAMALNCEQGPTAEPCLKCESCQRISEGTALDVVEIDAASNRGIDEIRALREKVALAPTDARFKVYIVDEVHMLTGEAFNAFLKTLEEPPAHVVFVLATTEPHRVLPTILSRCQRFDFHRISVDDKAVAMLAHAADGAVRDALTLLDQAAAYAEGEIGPEVITEILGGIDFDLVAEFADVFTRRDIGAALSLLDRVVAEGKDLRQLLMGMIGHYRNLLVLSVDRRAAEGLALPRRRWSASSICWQRPTGRCGSPVSRGCWWSCAWCASAADGSRPRPGPRRRSPVHSPPGRKRRRPLPRRTRLRRSPRQRDCPPSDTAG